MNENIGAILGTVGMLILAMAVLLTINRYKVPFRDKVIRKYGEVKWHNVCSNVAQALTVYDASKPKMDELKFVDDICRENKINRKEALFAIRSVRRTKKGS